jgi:glycosyltransferase involved in cell wall biosynthesis
LSEAVDGADPGCAVVACTAVSTAELPLARVLAEDIGRVHVGWRLVVLVLDADPPGDEPFETVGIEDLDLAVPGLLEIVTDGPRALAAALRPSLMSHCAARGRWPVVWLDATVRLFGPLDDLADAARDGLAVAPLHPSAGAARGLGARGPFESGAVAAGDLAMLRWWVELTVAEAQRGGARYDPLTGDAVALLLGAAERSRVLRDPGLCVGWWRLPGAGRLEGDPPEFEGRRLRALNLAGFDPARPHWLSSEDVDGSARVSDSPALAALLADHAERLRAAGWGAASSGGWRYSELPGGIAVDDDLRDLFALAREEGAGLGDPFTDAGCAAFLDWIDGESPLGGGVTWYLERVHRRRADLTLAFPDLAGGDGPRLVAWMGEHGAAEEPLLATLLARRANTGAGAAPREAPRAVAGPPPVRLIGYLRDGLGLGQAGRSYAGALEAAGLAVETVSVPVPLEHGAHAGRRPSRRQLVREARSAVAAGSAPAVEILCVNPPELLRLERAEPRRRGGPRRVGIWAWELDVLPESWSDAYPLVDEIWVYSEFVARAVDDAPVPVCVVPIPVDVDRLAAAAARAPAREGPFTFLFMFDLLSTLERKNPLGLIEAFRAAFEPGEGPRLLLKTSNGDNRPEGLERLRVAALGRPDIEIVDAFLPAAERDALIAGCDCYVSLHRAEGFGLTIAEAMAAGRPTIATGFSGNLEYMSSDTAQLVGSRPALVEPGSEVYTAGASWCEPDLAEAATLMRAIYADPGAERERAAAGREHVRRLLAPAAVGALARERIERLASGRARRGIPGLRAAWTRRAGL